MQTRKFLGLIVLALLIATLSNCGSFKSKERPTSLISVISSHDVDFLSINGTVLDATNTTAVVVVPGHNKIVFRWPRQNEDFRIPATYQITAAIEGGQEYLISANKSAHLPCLGKIDKLSQQMVIEQKLVCAVRH